MLRTLILNSELIALVRTVRAATSVEDWPDAPVKPPCAEERSDAPTKPPPMRASDLPIHETPHADYGEYKESKSIEEIINYIGAVQQESTKYIRHSIEYLQREENKEVRFGAVTVGGLTGFIFGRGSITRRLSYMGVGSLLLSCLCFPDEMKELAIQSLITAYNLFCVGKPDD